jgi:hypothetical protein
VLSSRHLSLLAFGQRIAGFGAQQVRSPAASLTAPDRWCRLVIRPTCPDARCWLVLPGGAAEDQLDAAGSLLKSRSTENTQKLQD